MPLFVFYKPPYLEYLGLTPSKYRLQALRAYVHLELFIVPEGDNVEELLGKLVRPSIRQVNNAAVATIANLA